ncbi:MAG: hypothetical protein OXR66_04655 [Candidatus Woesearchaeota archaeon]|nr:hypothetical protein [Candidatus Woesearchaeota archaeon]
MHELQETYRRIFERHEHPTEQDIVEAAMFPEKYSRFFKEYFTQFPEEAHAIVATHNERYAGMRTLCGMMRRWGNPAYGARYKAARERVRRSIN